MQTKNIALWIGVIGTCLVAAGRAAAVECDENNCGVDGCTITGNDCNGNGIEDDLDVILRGVQDCNGNRIPDVCELPDCQPIDVVFVVDTSSSMDPRMTPLCQQVNAAIATLRSEGLCFRWEILTIKDIYPPYVECPCCDGSVWDLYGTTTEGLPQEHSLDSCGSAEQIENWGPATAIVAGEKEWTPGPRLIVPISDEGPLCGGEQGYLDAQDTAAIESAIPIVWCNRVAVAPVNLLEYSDLEAVAQRLAEGGAPGGRALNIAIGPLDEEIADVIRSLCPDDCNSNDVIDACDIQQGTTPDCDGDGVPDLCESSPDCNGNQTPDAVDIAEGVSTDCDDNCVPDECEHAFVDCNENQVLDLCDITNGTSPDCFAYETDCCAVRCVEGGCDDHGLYDPDIATCVCGLEPIPGFLEDPESCCTTAWTQACVSAAEGICSLLCDPDHANGIPDECEPAPDCNCNSTPDAVDLANETSDDCNGNCIPDECDLTDDESIDDCNENGVPDECDIAAYTSCDADANGVPDECVACCLDGTCCADPECDFSECRNLTPDACSQTGGLPGEDWQVCEQGTCVKGPCCSGDICTETCAMECADFGQYWSSSSGGCSANTCATGACCGVSDCIDGVEPVSCPVGTFIGGATCEENVCEVTPPPCEQADIVWTDPPQCDPSDPLCVDVIDARQPHPVDDNSPDKLQGLGRWRAPAEPITIRLSESLPQALSPCCWDLWNTQQDTLPPSAIHSIVEMPCEPDTYVITLEEPIPAGHWTTVTYKSGNTTVCYCAHPANVNGDSSSAPSDILYLIDCLNQVRVCEIWQCDVDRSTLCGAPDILRVIDLLNGAGLYDPWLNFPLPENPCLAGGERGFATGFGIEIAAVDEHELFIDGFVKYVTTATPSDAQSVADFKIILDALTGFCVEFLSSAERRGLVDRLLDPAVEFASPVAREIVPDLSVKLLE